MNQRRGFTLIELSIVLVIIGLITGGVLVGRDLIQAATIRATVSQIQKYQAAVSTFRTKYNYLPGDIPDDQADQIGLIARSGVAGDGDGNGHVEYNSASCAGDPCMGGEIISFWTDLSGTGLIEGSFASNNNNVLVNLPAAEFSKYFPSTKVGQNSVVFAFDNGALFDHIPHYSGLVFEIAQPDHTSSLGHILVKDGLQPVEAQAIDAKIDDGLPLSGRMTCASPEAPGGFWSPATLGTGAGGGFGGAPSSSFCLDGASRYNVAHAQGAVCNVMFAAGL